MALINCPECGNVISNKAKACPKCGCPVTASSTSGEVAIKIGMINDNGVQAFMNKIKVYGPGDVLLAEGKQGNILRFRLSKTTHVEIVCSGHLNPIYSGSIKPNTRYEIVKVPSLLFSKFALNEIDVIDSGL